MTAAIGYGRTRAGMVGGSIEEEVAVTGTDVSPIRHSEAMLVAYDVRGTDIEAAAVVLRKEFPEMGAKIESCRLATRRRQIEAGS